jgi:hypothetical protein
LITTAVLALVLLWIGGRSSADLLARPGGGRVGVAHSSELSTFDEGIRSAVADGNSRIQSALEILENSHQTGESRMPLAQANGCSWPADVRRTSQSLHAAFLFGRVRAIDLMRHVELNAADTPLCRDQVQDLEAVVSAFNAAIGPLLTSYREIKARERITLIEAGKVRPWSETRLTGETVDAHARALMSDRGLSEADAKIEARKLLAAAESSPPGNHIRHDGVVYLAVDFPPLPVTEAYYDHVKFLVAEHASRVMSWFVIRGLCAEPAVVAKVLEKIARANVR